MARQSEGTVEVHGSSIRLKFTFGGERHTKRLLVDGRSLPVTAANLKYAKRLLDEINGKIKLDLFSMSEYFPSKGDTGEILTVGRQLDVWLDAQRIEKSTKAGYSSAVKFWKNDHDLQPVRTLKYSQILTTLAKRCDLSGKTINNYVCVLREALELAVIDGILTTNPAGRVPRAKHQKEPPDPFSREETDKIVAWMTDKYPGQVANLMEFWVWTGLRTSEVFALRWQNVDLASGYIQVVEANVRGCLKSTKTNTSRTVHLNSRAQAALHRQRAHTQMAGGLVFMDPRYDSGWEDERAFRRSFWEPTLKTLGIRYRRPYNMRHSYATAMLMAGMTPAFCAKQLGHSVEMFLRTYSKWLDGEQNDLEMARLETSLIHQLPKKVEQRR